MENTQENKRGRGRPSGTKNYVEMDKDQVLALFEQCETMPVSQKWLKTLGIDPSNFTVVESIKDAPKEEDKIEFTLEA